MRKFAYRIIVRAEAQGVGSFNGCRFPKSSALSRDKVTRPPMRSDAVFTPPLKSVAERTLREETVGMQGQTIAIDEACATGSDLLNRSQPIFGLAGVMVTSEEARGILETSGSETPHELHFIRLRRSEVGRRRILRILSHELLAARAQTSVTEKRFMLCGKLVDNLLELPLHEQGKSIYTNNMHVRMATILHRQGARACGPPAWEALLRSFMDLSRSPDLSGGPEFLSALHFARMQCQFEAVYEILSLMPASMEALMATGSFYSPDRAASSLDPAPPALVQLLNDWNGNFNLPVETTHEVIHDKGSPGVTSWTDVFQAAMAERPLTTFTMPEGSEVRFPLPTRQLPFGDSVQWPALQLADLVVGATVFVLAACVSGTSSDMTFARRLQELGVLNLMKGWVWPADEDPRDCVLPHATHE
jgi:hypothetical protein